MRLDWSGIRSRYEGLAFQVHLRSPVAEPFLHPPADVNWVPTLSFIAGAIEDLDLNCDELVALGREVFAEAYPFPDDAEVPFPFHALAATHRRLWEVCVGGGGIAPEIGEPEMRNARLEMFLLAVGISAHVMQHQSAVLGRFQSPGEYIRNIANTYIVDISITS